MDIEARIADMAASCGGDFGVAAKSLHTGEEVMLLADESFNAASVIKVPIMVEVFRQAEEGLIDLEASVELADTDKVGGSGILKVLSHGMRISIIDLVRLMIVVSDNTASNLVVDLVGIHRVNQTMRDLGFSGIVLRRKFMTVPAARPIPNSITPRDMTGLLEGIARGRVVSNWACIEMVKIMKQQQYNELIPALLPASEREDGDLVGGVPQIEIAHKTGSVSRVRHDAGIVYTPARDYVVTILTKDLPRPLEGEETIRKISLELYSHFTKA